MRQAGNVDIGSDIGREAAQLERSPRKQGLQPAEAGSCVLIGVVLSIVDEIADDGRLGERRGVAEI